MSWCRHPAAIIDESEFMPTIDSVNAPVTDSDIIFVLAFGIGIVAGLRSFTAPAVVSWVAHLRDFNWVGEGVLEDEVRPGERLDVFVKVRSSRPPQPAWLAHGDDGFELPEGRSEKC